jgi:hypothetical protein
MVQGVNRNCLKLVFDPAVKSVSDLEALDINLFSSFTIADDTTSYKYDGYTLFAGLGKEKETAVTNDWTNPTPQADVYITFLALGQKTYTESQVDDLEKQNADLIFNLMANGVI